MRLLFFIPLFGVLAAGQGQQDPIEFINPPPGGPVGDYSLNPTFVLGSNVNIQWRWTSAATSTSEALSLVVWQELRGAEFEHIFRTSLPVPLAR